MTTMDRVPDGPVTGSVGDLGQKSPLAKFLDIVGGAFEHALCGVTQHGDPRQVLWGGQNGHAIFLFVIEAAIYFLNRGIHTVVYDLLRTTLI